jgi:hypothetical protein
VDDTGARHAGRTGLCTQIGNDDFTWFGTRTSKSRLNFLDLLRAGHSDDVVNDAALDYMRFRSLAGPLISRLATARASRIFARRTGFAALDRLLARLHANKPELLMVLDRPEIPLHTNGSERDIGCQVIKRKVSGGTHSLAGRDCREAFLGLMHTCAKLGIAFWDYLGNRIGVAAQPDLPALPDISLARGQTV